MSAGDTGPVRPDEPHAGPVDEDGQFVPAPGEDPAAGPEPDVVTGEIAGLTGQLAELTGDLQRLQADYANYRRRVDREREQQRDQVVGSVLVELLPVLDDIGRAREHDELTGGFKSVGESLEATVGKLGLERYGAVGDPFDPQIHEALSHVHSADVTETTCVEVYQPGYRHADRILRPARVVVADPTPDADSPTD